MTNYVFCAWVPEGPVGKTVADVIGKRTDAWTKERQAKGKVGYTFVYYEPDDDEKRTLADGDQIYIKGHHAVGLDFISDFTSNTQTQVRKGQRVEVPATKLNPEILTNRLAHCFAGSETFIGKIKFFNCSSGANNGASFAKIAANRMRAIWPRALYIGYSESLDQNYGDFTNADRQVERRKLGKSGLRAKSLHVPL